MPQFAADAAAITAAVKSTQHATFLSADEPTFSTSIGSTKRTAQRDTHQSTEFSALKPTLGATYCATYQPAQYTAFVPAL